MRQHVLGSALTLALTLAATALPAAATSLLGDEADATAYRQQQRDKLEILRSDGSPRVQVLAGQIWLDSDDPANRLLPRPQEVVARAVRLAPDDAFVQWAAADQGSYTSSQCGPTTWPEVEVANLTRLEADNAGAWQYAVALARAKGDAAAIDAALAHMAGAKRATDHRGEAALAWARLAQQHPQWPGFGDSDEDSSGDDDAVGESAMPPLPARALVYGFMQTTSYSGGPTRDALTAVCKPDGDSERTWQRLGWCVRAGELLAHSGNSFELRETGLAMLAAAGATADDLADPRRELQWLQENAADPRHNDRVMDEPAELLADWRDAGDEITATRARMKRLGLSATPPAGWVPASQRANEEAISAGKIMAEYVAAVFADLEASSDVRERALGLALQPSTQPRGESLGADSDADAASAAPDPSPLRDLAAAHPQEVFVQWLAATHADDKDAVATLQRLEPANAAVWLLVQSDDATATAAALHHAAAATRYDDHARESIRLLHAAFMRHPAPAALLQMDSGLAAEAGAGHDARSMAAAMAVGYGIREWGGPVSTALRLCKDTRGDAADTLATDCITFARHVIATRSSVLDAMVALGILRSHDALTDADRALQRQIQWWQRVMVEGSAADLPRYLDDFLATGSEFEALERMARRAGKLDPPADWQPRARH